MPVTYSSTVNVPTTFDRTGMTDITVALANWLNNNTNVPQGPSTNVHTRVLFSRFQADGVTRARYRIEGGVTGGGCTLGSSRVNISLDGGGTPGNRGLDGAQFVQTLKAPYAALPGPANPRGRVVFSGATISGGNTLTAPLVLSPLPLVGDQVQLRYDLPQAWVAGTTYATGAFAAVRYDAANDLWTIYRSLVNNNTGHNPATSPAWWAVQAPWPRAVRTIASVAVTGGQTVITFGGTAIGPYTNIAFCIQPNDEWQTIYTPTGEVNTSTTAKGGFDTVYDNIKNHTQNVNGSRSFFKVAKSTHLRFVGMQITGSYDGSGYLPILEAQDCIKFMGSNDCVIDDCTIGKSWGNGLQIWPFDESDGSLTAAVGTWVHDSTFGGGAAGTQFGRQCASFQFGAQIIVEKCTMGGSARTLIDIEPTASFSRRDPRLGALVENVFLFDNVVTSHGLGGIISLHEGVDKVHIKGNSGAGIGSGSVWAVDNIIVENNNQTSGNTSSSPFDLARGSQANRGLLGGRNILIRNNQNFDCNDAGVHFHATPRAVIAAASNGVHTNTLTGTQAVNVDSTLQYPDAGTAQVGTTGTTFISWTATTATQLRNVTGSGPDKVLLTGMPLPTAIGCQNYSVTGNDFGLKNNGQPNAQFIDDNDPPWAGTFAPFTLTPVHAMRNAAVATDIIVNGATALENDVALAGSAVVDDQSLAGRRYVIQ